MLSACSEEVVDVNHYENAKRFLEEKDKKGAIAELKAAIQDDDNTAEASALLGEIYYKAGDYQDAEKELSRALSLGAKSNDVVPMLAQILLSLDAYESLDNLSLEDLDPEGRSIVQAAKGLSMIYRENLLVASEIIEAALQNEPRSPYADVAAARLSMENGALDEALVRLEDVLSIAPGYVPAWSLKGDIESATLRPKQAAAAYGKVIKYSGNGFDPLLNRALMLIYLGKFGDARKDLDRIGKTFRRSEFHPGVQFATGLVQLISKQLVPARKTFFTTSDFSNLYPQTLYYLAAIELESGLPGQALSYAYRFLGLVPDSLAGAKLAAKIEMSQGRFQRAETLLRPAVKANPVDIEASSLLADTLNEQGRAEEAAGLMAGVVELQPDSIEARARLGETLLSTESAELGLQTLNGILDQDPGYEQADTLIMMYYLRQNKPAEAIKSAQMYRERSPDSAILYDLLGNAYLAEGDVARASEAFEIAWELRPGDPEAGRRLAEIALSRKDFEAVRNRYREVLVHNPEHMQSSLGIVASFALEGKEEEMLGSLERALLKHSREMEPHLIKARYHLGKGELDAVMPLLDELVMEERESPQALEVLAGFELASERYHQALATLNKLVKLDVNASQYRYMRARAYVGLEEPEKAIDELEKALELNPNHFFAQVAAARLALLSGQDEAFESEVDQLREIAPGNPDVMKLEAFSALKKGDMKGAELLLRTAFDLDPTAINAIALADYYQAEGDTDGAIEQLQDWLQRDGDDIRVRERLAEVYRSSNRFGGAIYQYRRILKINPEHLIALNNLGWLLLDEESAQALSYAEKAANLYPDSGAVIDTLAMTQLKNERVIEARRSIDRVLRMDSRNPEFRYHDVLIRLAEGDATGASKELTNLLESPINFPQRAEAEVLQNRLK